jgi:hypothetical protein
MKRLRKTGFFFVSVVVISSMVILLQVMTIGGDINMEGTETAENNGLPPIDRLTPGRLETATFALS